MNKFIVFVCFFAICVGLQAQNRTEFGGKLGLQFGSTTLIELSPRVGYWFTNYFVSGVGGSYVYMNDSRQGGYKGSLYGVSIYSRLYPTRSLYLQVEYSKMNIGIPAGGGVVYRIWTEGLLMGGGYVQPISDNTAINFSILWDVIGQQNFPYSNPVINAGIVTRF